MFLLFKSFKPLKINDEGPRVQEVSEMLRKHGSNIKVSNVFSIGMNNAVRNFQRKNGLEVTGVVDKLTWKALKKKPNQNGSETVQ